MLISLYTEKAFDKIQPPFLVNILTITGSLQFVKMSEAVRGFGENVIALRWVHNQQEAHVIISHSFKDCNPLVVPLENDDLGVINCLH